MLPMSEEGFLALADEVVGELNDASTLDTMRRLGLPPEATIRFLSRTVTSLNPDLSPSGQNNINALADLFVIGVLIGHKAGSWQEKADARSD